MTLSFITSHYRICVLVIEIVFRVVIDLINWLWDVWSLGLNGILVPPTGKLIHVHHKQHNMRIYNKKKNGLLTQ